MRRKCQRPLLVPKARRECSPLRFQERHTGSQKPVSCPHTQLSVLESSAPMHAMPLVSYLTGGQGGWNQNASSACISLKDLRA